MSRTPRTLLLALALALWAAPLRAQGAPAIPLEQFVQQVAWLWGMGDVGSLVELLPSRQRVVLDTGSGTEAVTARHAAAAMRALFDGREHVSVRPVRVTVASRNPPRGFGELAWSHRVRGAPAVLTRTVYVAAVWDEGAWRINELRLMP